jgi:hypothetical protein
VVALDVVVGDVFSDGCAEVAFAQSWKAGFQCSLMSAPADGRAMCMDRLARERPSLRVEDWSRPGG